MSDWVISRDGATILLSRIIKFSIFDLDCGFILKIYFLYINYYYFIIHKFKIINSLVHIIRKVMKITELVKEKRSKR